MCPRTDWEKSLLAVCRQLATRGPSTALLSLRDSNSAQDDRGESTSGERAWRGSLEDIGAGLGALGVLGAGGAGNADRSYNLAIAD